MVAEVEASTPSAGRVRNWDVKIPEHAGNVFVADGRGIPVAGETAVTRPAEFSLNSAARADFTRGRCGRCAHAGRPPETVVRRDCAGTVVAAESFEQALAVEPEAGLPPAIGEDRQGTQREEMIVPRIYRSRNRLAFYPARWYGRVVAVLIPLAH
jgi:hypothetical protein